MKLKYIAILLIGLWACDTSRVYEKNIDFNDQIWQIDSVAHFDFNISAPEKTYNVYLNIRNTNTYPYHNLYVKYTLADSLDTLQQELVNQDLFHKLTGQPLGSGLGDIFSHQFLILEGYKFDKEGDFNMSLQQFMRQDSLQGIVSAGVRIEEAPIE